jgi:spore germination cell wall hydrolase CwlJ-like protein
MITLNFKSEVAILLAFLAIVSMQIAAYRYESQVPIVIYVTQPVMVPTPVVNKTQLKCLAEAIYFEARDQSIQGQKAVGHVIVNRTKEDQFPNTVCGVVHEKKSGRCQFSYFCEGLGAPTDIDAYNQAKTIARQVLHSDHDITSGALFYHTKDVHPVWNRKMQKVADIGDHVFYNLKAV